MFETITNCSPGWSGSWAICKINVKRQSTRLKQGSEYWIHKKNWPAIIFQLSFTSYFLKTVSMSSGSQWSAETWHSCAQVKQTVRFARKILVSKVSLGYFCFSPRVQVSFTRHDAPKSFFFFCYAIPAVFGSGTQPAAVYPSSCMAAGNKPSCLHV